MNQHQIQRLNTFSFVTYPRMKQKHFQHSAIECRKKHSIATSSASAQHVQQRILPFEIKSSLVFVINQYVRNRLSNNGTLTVYKKRAWPWKVLPRVAQRLLENRSTKWGCILAKQNLRMPIDGSHTYATIVATL